MKIKAVCEQTGLTDRTIRYYIEEGLISPFYTENYLGRKNFDFSEADVETLKDIAILRKFGFSIAEIKQLSQHPEETVSIIQRLQARKQQDVDDELSMLSVLKQLDAEKTHTISELSDAPSTRQLSQMEIQKPAPSRPLYLSPGPFSRELSDFSH